MTWLYAAVCALASILALLAPVLVVKAMERDLKEYEQWRGR